MVCWAQAHRVELLAVLRPSYPRLPSPATWRRLLDHIDMAALEQQVAAYKHMLDAADALSGRIALRNGATLRGQAVDGEDVRGASAHGEHTLLVSLVRHESAYVLGQAAVDVKTNEITAVPALLAGRDSTDTVTTMDALLTQRQIAQPILTQGGHYVMIIKQNQKTLHWAAQLVFAEPPLPRRQGERRTVRTVDKTHGRWERRTLTATTPSTTTWTGLGRPRCYCACAAPFMNAPVRPRSR